MIIKWKWTHGSLYFDDSYEMIDDAVASAYWDGENGNAYTDCIEVWDDSGHRVIRGEELSDLIGEYENRLMESWPTTESPKPVALVKVQHPDGRWAGDQYADMGRADAEANRLVRVLGPGRVKIELLP